MAITLKDIRFNYPGRPDKLILNVPNWEIPTGDHLFLHGPSGSGKSTLLNLLCGLLSPVSGELSVFEQRLDQMTGRARDRFRAQHIGYVFQQFNLVPYLNAMENIKLAAKFSGKKTESPIQQTIQDLLNQLNIPEQEWRTPADKLSIGQQQRVAIARALVNKPKLLIADEPTSALDQANRDAFMSLLMPMVKDNNITLLFVSHDVTLSEYIGRSEALNEINQA